MRKADKAIASWLKENQSHRLTGPIQGNLAVGNGRATRGLARLADV